VQSFVALKARVPKLYVLTIHFGCDPPDVFAPRLHLVRSQLEDTESREIDREQGFQVCREIFEQSRLLLALIVLAIDDERFVPLEKLIGIGLRKSNDEVRNLQIAGLLDTLSQTAGRVLEDLLFDQKCLDSAAPACRHPRSPGSRGGSWRPA